MDRDKAIRNTHPTVVTIYDEKEALDNNGQPVTIDEAKVSIEMERLQADYDSMNYSRRRKAEYPPLEDVTIALAEKAEGRSEMWDEITAKRATVRTKYPKP